MLPLVLQNSWYEDWGVGLGWRSGRFFWSLERFASRVWGGGRSGSTTEASWWQMVALRRGALARGREIARGGGRKALYLFLLLYRKGPVVWTQDLSCAMRTMVEVCRGLASLAWAVQEIIHLLFPQGDTFWVPNGQLSNPFLEYSQVINWELPVALMSIHVCQCM